MCKACNDTGRIVQLVGSITMFRPCENCDINEKNREKVIQEIDALRMKLQQRRLMRAANQ